MNKKFTEGIWYVDTESDGNLWIATGKSTAAIANICCSSSNGKTYEPSDEEKANAQLIVSAPLMLDELSQIKHYAETALKSLNNQSLAEFRGMIEGIIQISKDTIKEATE